MSLKTNTIIAAIAVGAATGIIFMALVVIAM